MLGRFVDALAGDSADHDPQRPSLGGTDCSLLAFWGFEWTVGLVVVSARAAARLYSSSAYAR